MIDLVRIYMQNEFEIYQKIEIKTTLVILKY